MISIKKDSLPPENSKNVVRISRKWELPPILKEISGIVYLDSSRLLCVQDEVGSVFIYNLTTSAIEGEIPFGPPGDYEALALVKETVYVACADGRLFEIAAINSGNPVIREYGTHLTVQQNVEGLCYDPKSKMLLVAIKGKEENNAFFKGIYAFDPVTKKMAVKPAMSIDLQDPVFGRNASRKLQLLMQPSEVAVHPLTGDVYVTDAMRPQLLVMNKSADIKNLYLLSKTDFPQPEGITFSPEGGCYISNQGSKEQPGTLLLVELP